MTQPKRNTVTRIKPKSPSSEAGEGRLLKAESLPKGNQHPAGTKLTSVHFKLEAFFVHNYC